MASGSDPILPSLFMDNNSKLEQYILLAKAARGLALADLICKAAAEQGLFTYGELLSLPSVQELRAGEHSRAYSLLALFAYGTWSDYRASPDSVLPLSSQQQHKLKLLTIVTLANGVRTLPYSHLMSALEVSSVRELEDILITDCFYSGLIRGRLDQEQRCLLVEEAFCRDVRPEQLGEVTAALGTWLQNAQAVLQSIETKVQYVAEATAAAEKVKADMQASLESEKKSLRTAAELQAQQEASLMDDSEGGSLAVMEDDTRPSGKGAGRHTKRRR